MTLEPFAAPPVTPEVLRALSRRHGLPEAPLSLLPSTGINNVIYALGNDYVLRVARNHGPIFDSSRKEAVAVAAARAAGVHTPELVAFDDSRELLPVPYSVYERVHGDDLGTHDDDFAKDEVWRAVGRDLARLHQGVSRGGPAGRLAAEPFAPPDPYALAEAGYFSEREARWLASWLAKLGALAPEPAPARFCHGDVQATNILVGRGGGPYLALLDWGSCGWNDPAVDFAGAPLSAAPFLLQGHRDIAPLPHDETAEARILRWHLSYALDLARRAPAPTRSWAERPLGQLLEVTRFLLTETDSRWTALRPPARAG